MTLLAGIAPTTSSPAPRLVDELVEQHRDALLAYAQRLLPDHHLAEDIVQETFIRAWRHADRLLNREGSVRGWLFKVARNLIVDRSRSAYARHETVTTDDGDPAQEDHTGPAHASMEAVSLLRSLSPEHRNVLVYLYIYGLTVDETARVLCVPAGTVRSRRHLALRALRNRRASLGY
ncbi:MULTISPECIES: sigma-70 family RNA polymerase sigma factor [Streptomyces]|jgi:RNA polymerase sigma-70 factor, ECF subfamily|uniref:Sigma-70 family RNA polymerase sigma factor n=1 Tax=Streptomyces ortus TaxID=2867268 RepID=A0ABT3VDU0_9ACTN|nr:MULTISPECIES: sigma-70 family RNA polymerase sigma factor [Streptomyces]MCX4238104.1 sigma-70 family RNA polymerase sigma factor [Streptomyces ortus]